jgi:hypothetical protein
MHPGGESILGDTYYAILGDENPPLFKSKDLKTWTTVSDFMRHQLPDVARREDISCANFFPLGDKWMLLCISHMVGCRYYIGDWDAEAEQFVPEKHGRMNWRRDEDVDTRQKIAETIGVTTRWIRKIVQQQRETGSIEDWVFLYLHCRFARSS